MGWMWIFWILVIVLIVYAIWRPSPWTGPRDESSLSAEEILKRRYARGEVGKEEYDRKLEDLRK
jgi:putative membrane protein